MECKRWFGLFLGLALLATPIGSAQETPSEIEEPVTRDRSSSMVELERASLIMGMDVRNKAGEKLASVKEIVLNESRSDIAYVVMSTGLLGWKSIAAPWSEFDVQYAEAGSEDPSGNAKAECLILNLDKWTMDQFKGFDEATWPRRVGADWQHLQRHERWESAKQSDTDMKTFETRRLSKLIGSEIALSATEEAAPAEKSSVLPHEDPSPHKAEAMTETSIGVLRDAVINARNGRVGFGFVEVATIEGMEGHLCTVPWTSLEFESEPRIHASLQARDREMLKPFTFKAGEEASQVKLLGDREYSRQLYMAYQQGPQWEALGYVEPESRAEPEAHPDPIQP